MPETNYTFRVTARYKVPEIDSEEAVFNLSVGAGMPFFKGEPAWDDEEDMTQERDKEHAIILDTTTFSNDNGRVRRYEILLSEGCDHKLHEKLISNGSAIDLRPRVKFVIGKDWERCSGCDNPPLKPSTRYSYRVRIYTSSHSNESESKCFSTVGKLYNTNSFVFFSYNP
ncbi:uncharacterized protein [Procambarus clarkii]|uniref:uncharacterized protein n=1 Tax=Procambarus clarkii TaxID=6728 RepID=UPI00374349D5